MASGYTKVLQIRTEVSRLLCFVFLGGKPYRVRGENRRQKGVVAGLCTEIAGRSKLPCGCAISVYFEAFQRGGARLVAVGADLPTTNMLL